jgi:hypothetical protein
MQDGEKSEERSISLYIEGSLSVSPINSVLTFKIRQNYGRTYKVFSAHSLRRWRAENLNQP